MTTAVAAPEAPARRLIRLSKAIEQLGISRGSLYKLIETDPRFPRPVRLHGEVRGGPLLFFQDEISHYLSLLADAR